MSRQRKTLVHEPVEGHTNSGLTLIECLVAIAVIGLTTATIAPIMVFAMATRVQSQRAEQAFQLAQGEVEEMRLMVERGGDFSSSLASYPVTTAASVNATGAPTTTAASLDSTTTNVARLVNTDNDSDSEFAVQVFRSAGVQPSGSPVPIAFELGVRVYDAKAFDGSTLQTDAAALSFTSGEGERGTRPLAVIYADFLKGDGDDALCEYWKYISTASTGGINDCP